MSALMVGIDLVPVRFDPYRSDGAGAEFAKPFTVDAELLDIGRRFCRIRVPRDRFHLNPADVRVRFAWTDLVAHVIWTHTTEKSIEMGLLMPADEVRVPDQEPSGYWKD